MLSLVQWLTWKYNFTINDGSDMIRFCHRSMSDTAEKGGVC